MLEFHTIFFSSFQGLVPIGDVHVMRDHDGDDVDIEEIKQMQNMLKYRVVELHQQKPMGVVVRHVVIGMKVVWVPNL